LEHMSPRGTIPFALPPFSGWVRRLVLACTAMLIVQVILQVFARNFYRAYFETCLGLIPSFVLHGYIWQLFTYSLLHEGLWHLLGNMLAVWMVGSILEMEWGSRRFLELYFFSVVGGALVTIAAAYGHVFGSSPETLVLGASAGSLGLLMALAVTDGDREFTLLLAFIIPITMRVKYLVAIIVLGVFVATLIPSGDRVANFAHVGGLLFGFLYAKYIPRRGLGFEASEKYYGVRNEWQRWKRWQAAKKFEVYMRKFERDVRFDEKGNYIPPEDEGPRKPNGSSGSKWVN
jgi:membrane associated rhomboid family serine protease